MNQDELNNKINQLSDIIQVPIDKYNELKERYEIFSEKIKKGDMLSDADLEEKELLEQDLQEYEEKIDLLSARLKVWKEKYGKKLKKIKQDIKKQRVRGGIN